MTQQRFTINDLMTCDGEIDLVYELDNKCEKLAHNGC